MGVVLGDAQAAEAAANADWQQSALLAFCMCCSCELGRLWLQERAASGRFLKGMLCRLAASSSLAFCMRCSCELGCGMAVGASSERLQVPERQALQAGSNLRAMHAACAAAVSWAGCGMAARASGGLLQDPEGQALQAGSILQPRMLHAQQE